MAGDRTVSGAVAIADNEERVVMKGVGDDILIQVIAQVAIESGADVFIDRLQLDEHQRQAVDEADQIRAAVVAGRAQAGDFEFAHGDEAVVRFAIRAFAVLKINHPRPHVATAAPVRILVTHRHAVADEFVKLLIVLEQRPREIVPRHLLHRLGDGGGRQLRIQPHQRRAQFPRQHHLARVRAAQRAIRPEGFLVPRIDTFPTQTCRADARRTSFGRAGLRC